MEITIKHNGRTLGISQSPEFGGWELFEWRDNGIDAVEGLPNVNRSLIAVLYTDLAFVVEVARKILYDE